MLKQLTRSVKSSTWTAAFFNSLVFIMKFAVYVILIVSCVLLPAIIAAPFYDKIIQDGIKNISESAGKSGVVDNNWLQNFQGMMQDGIEILGGQESAHQLVGKVMKQFREMIETGENADVIKDFAENLLMEFQQNDQ